MRTNTYRATVSGSTKSYTYDANGSLTVEGTKTYEWDGANRLVRVLDNAAEVARSVYDGEDRRVQKIAGGMTRTYVYDEDIVEERPGAGATVRHVHGPGIDQPLANVESGITSYYLADHLGSIVQMTSAAATVTLTRQYDAWATSSKAQRAAATPSREGSGIRRRGCTTTERGTSIPRPPDFSARIPSRNRRATGPN